MARLRNKARSDNRVQGKVYLGRGEDGKKKYKYVYAANNAELQKKLDEQKTLLGKGIDITAERDTFKQWGDMWLSLKETQVSHSQYIAYRSHFSKFEPIYNIPVSKLRQTDFQRIITELGSRDKPLSAKTLQGVKQTAQQIMRLAIANRVIDFNCADNLIIPKTAKEPEHKRALTDEEQRWIRETPHRAQTAAMIMMYAGLRRGELLALTWSDIDLDGRTISVNKAVEFIDDKPRVKNCGKSDAAMRTVFIPQILIDYLREVPRKTLIVCPNTKGKTMSKTSWDLMWKSYIKELNIKWGDFDNLIGKRPTSKFQPGGVPIIIPSITAHWLRHTFVTNLYFAGVDLVTAKDQAGHSDIRTTTEIYTHLNDEHRAAKMKAVDDYFDKINATKIC